jgi:hypothetical protein
LLLLVPCIYQRRPWFHYAVMDLYVLIYLCCWHINKMIMPCLHVNLMLATIFIHSRLGSW